MFWLAEKNNVEMNMFVPCCTIIKQFKGKFDFFFQPEPYF